MNDITHTLLGALLVVIGVVAAAVADRIRGIRATRDRAAFTPRETSETKRPSRELAKLAHDAATGGMARNAMAAMASDVKLALVTMGYPKAVSGEAVEACHASECSTMESWTRAALRHCMAKEKRA